MILSKVSVLTPNEVEAEQLTGISVQNTEDATKTARKLLGYGVGAAAITLGQRGVLVLSQSSTQPTVIPAHSVKAVDTVAAGDAFNGALAVRLAEGESLVSAAG